MKVKQKSYVKDTIDNVQYTLDHPWSKKWVVVEKLRRARSMISLTLRNIQRNGIGRG